MLVLRRTIGRTVVVEHGGQRMEIKILDVDSRNTVKIGFEADKSWSIFREEVQKLRDEKEEIKKIQ